MSTTTPSLLSRTIRFEMHLERGLHWSGELDSAIVYMLNHKSHCYGFYSFVCFPRSGSLNVSSLSTFIAGNETVYFYPELALSFHIPLMERIDCHDSGRSTDKRTHEGQEQLMELHWIWSLSVFCLSSPRVHLHLRSSSVVARSAGSNLRSSTCPPLPLPLGPPAAQCATASIEGQFVYSPWDSFVPPAQNDLSASSSARPLTHKFVSWALNPRGLVNSRGLGSTVRRSCISAFRGELLSESVGICWIVKSSE